MKIIVDRSPHQSARKPETKIRCVMLHADVSGSAASSIAWLKAPASQASYHIIVERNGDITQLVADDMKAWHAGVSGYAGLANVNEFSLGLCFSNRQDGIEPFDARAIASGVSMVAGWLKKYLLGLDAITTHEACARPMGRKSDPGPLFPFSPFVTAVRRKLGG